MTDAVTRSRGDVRIEGRKGFGRKLSKLASATPAIIRSSEAQERIAKKLGRSVEAMVRKYQSLSGNRANDVRIRSSISAALVRLCVPMFKVSLDGFSFYASPNVVSDYYREGYRDFVVAYPIVQKHGRIASVRITEKELEYVEEFANGRANRHACGYAQTAYRVARLNNDAECADEARRWLIAGTCKYLAKNSEDVIVQRLMSLFDEEFFNDARSYFYGSRLPHKMRQPSIEELPALFASGWSGMVEVEAVENTRE